MTYTINCLDSDCNEIKKIVNNYCDAIRFVGNARIHGCFAIIVTVRDASGKKIREENY